MVDESIVLRSERFAVEIARPGAAYRGTRFDWTGLVTQVTLDGRHTFCVPEDFGSWKGTGGAGLCNEFGIDAPIGYADAKPGELFPKLGIGLLERPARADYQFGTPHRIAQRFPTRVVSEPERVVFTVEPLDCRGYAARLTKTLTVANNRLDFAYRLENTGTRPLHTNEYGHNFVAIDRHALGPDYVLRFPCPVVLEQETEANAILKASGRELSLRAVPTKPFYCRLKNFAASDGPQWELIHRPSGLSMSETVNFAPSRVALWGTDHVASVEIFIPIELAPGAVMAWMRRFQFG